MTTDNCVFDEASLLIELLEKNYDSHMNIVWASIALLLGAIGWIITSQEARSFLNSSRVTKLSSQITIIVMALTHYYLLWVTWDISSQLVFQLSKLIGNDVGIIHQELFIYHISSGAALSRAVVTFILFSFLYLLATNAGSKST